MRPADKGGNTLYHKEFKSIVGLVLRPYLAEPYQHRRRLDTEKKKKSKSREKQQKKTNVCLEAI